jgi:hypothetical protein
MSMPCPRPFATLALPMALLLAAPAQVGHAEPIDAGGPVYPLYGANLARLVSATDTRGSRHTYYIDCSAARRGDGSMAAPLDGLAAANAIALQPGDALAFRRGTTCRGQLLLRASGTDAAPILVGSYGHGSAARIDANGAVAAVQLRNAAWVTVQDLELTAPGDGRTPRRGVWAVDDDGGDLAGLVLQRLAIHDVRGVTTATRPDLGLPAGKYAGASGGIVLEALGNTRPSAFVAPVIRDNDLRTVGREGIYLWSNWCVRPQLARFWAGKLCTAPWHPAERPLIENNRLVDIGGDGIAPMTVAGGRIAHNTLDGFNRYAGGYNAGMWSANSVDVVFAHNATSGGKTTNDGMAYDVDHSSQGMVFEYNYSHDNEGGFFLICPYGVHQPGSPEHFTIAWNLSVDDHARSFQICAGGGVDSGRIHNNTIVVPDSGQGTHALVWTSRGLPKDAVKLRFDSNLWLRLDSRASLPLAWAASNQGSISSSHDLYDQVPPMPGARDAVLAPAALTAATPASRNPRDFVPTADSPAVHAGRPLTDAAATDFFGHRVDPKAPGIGFAEPAQP